MKQKAFYTHALNRISTVYVTSLWVVLQILKQFVWIMILSAFNLIRAGKLSLACWWEPNAICWSALLFVKEILQFVNKQCKNIHFNKEKRPVLYRWLSVKGRKIDIIRKSYMFFTMNYYSIVIPSNYRAKMPFRQSTRTIYKKKRNV